MLNKFFLLPAKLKSFLQQFYLENVGFLTKKRNKIPRISFVILAKNNPPLDIFKENSSEVENPKKNSRILRKINFFFVGFSELLTVFHYFQKPLESFSTRS